MFIDPDYEFSIFGDKNFRPDKPISSEKAWVTIIMIFSFTVISFTLI